jgi:hypothetical protein
MASSHSAVAATRAPSRFNIVSIRRLRSRFQLRSRIEKYVERIMDIGPTDICVISLSNRAATRCRTITVVRGCRHTPLPDTAGRRPESRVGIARPGSPARAKTVSGLRVWRRLQTRAIVHRHACRAWNHWRDCHAAD